MNRPPFNENRCHNSLINANTLTSYLVQAAVVDVGFFLIGKHMLASVIRTGEVVVRAQLGMSPCLVVQEIPGTRVFNLAAALHQTDPFDSK